MNLKKEKFTLKANGLMSLTLAALAGRFSQVAGGNGTSYWFVGAIILAIVSVYLLHKSYEND